MNFEYDKNKSASNKLKHDIDFEKAKKLWDDPYSIEIPALNNKNENRYLVFGQINFKHYTAIITYRNSIIRIISVRRSRKQEIEFYEKIKIR